MDGDRKLSVLPNVDAPMPIGIGQARPQVKSKFRNYHSLADFERSARRRLPRMLYSFIAGGAEDEVALKGNRAAFEAYAFVPRILASTANRTQATELFGKTYDVPFGIAPMGIGALFAYRSDLQFARAAEDLNLPFALSASSLIPMEDVVQIGSTAWYQAYLPGEDQRIEALVERVALAGFDTFVLTVDVPVPANRENNERNGFTTPLRPSFQLLWDGISHPRWLVGTAVRTLIQHGMPHFENTDASRGPPILSRDLTRASGLRDQLDWKHLELIRQRWNGNLIVKGVLSAEDARLAKEKGADGVIVSNHGGRQLDGAIAPLRVLSEVVDVAGDMKVLFDGGIRRGGDVLKALALGASFVFVGRPFLYAAVVGGEPAVRHAADLLRNEIDRNMALLGIRTLRDLQSSHVRRINR